MNLLEARLVESRQRALDLANRLEEADRRACAAEQQLDDQTAAIELLKRSEQNRWDVIREEIRRIRETNTSLEAWLAVAVGLLKRALRPTYLGTSLNNPTAAEIASFLADSSQATEGYRWALQVVERVKDIDLITRAIDNRMDVDATDARLAAAVQKALLGDAAQEEKP